MANKILTVEDILPEYDDKVRIQDYSKKQTIEGVSFYDIRNFVSEDGSFSEVARFDKEGSLELIPGFKVEQINYSVLLPGVIKAWHLHYSQEDVWYIPPDQRLIVGLVDLRKSSPTKEVKMRFVMGGGKSQLLYIPRGVAHGCANLSTDTMRMMYFVNQQFSVEKSDERRLKWDLFGGDFWKIIPS